MIRSLAKGQRAALIVNECQLGVIDARFTGFPALAAQVEARGIVARIAELAEVFRAAGAPVVHAPVAHRPDFADIRPNSLINSLSLKHRRMAAGAPETDYVEALRPRPEDFIIERSAGIFVFNATSLDALLRRLEIETVVLTGVSTNLAIPGNTMTAVDLGYAVVVPEDCIAGSDPETHQTIVENQLRLLAVMSTAAEVADAIRSRGLTSATSQELRK